MFSKHFKLIESSLKLNLVQSYRTLVLQTILYSVSTNDDVVILSTDSVKVDFNITKEGSDKSLCLGGQVIINKCGTIIIISKYQINGSHESKNFLQKINTTSSGNNIPLLYPWYMIFPSIFFIPVGDILSGLGYIAIIIMKKLIECLGLLRLLRMYEQG